MIKISMAFWDKERFVLFCNCIVCLSAFHWETRLQIFKKVLLNKVKTNLTTVRDNQKCVGLVTLIYHSSDED